MELSSKNIIPDSDERIRLRSENVELPLSEKDRELLLAMHRFVKDSTDETLCKEKDLIPSVGLAAIQLGVPKKMIAVVVPSDEEDEPDLEWALVNPKIISKSTQLAYLSGGEGCLSVPQAHPGPVPRPARIKVRGYDLLSDQNVVISAEGYPAIVLQHEIDHLSGILYYDRIRTPQQIPEDALEI